MDHSPRIDNENKLSESLLGQDVEQQPTGSTPPIQQLNNHQSVPVVQVTGPNGEAVAGGEDILQPAQGLRAEPQVGEYRDAPFAIGFLAHLVVVSFVAFSWGVSSLRKSTDDSSSSSSYTPPEASSSYGLSGFIYLLLLTALASMGISALSLELMTRFAEQLIQCSLIASCSLLGLIVLTMFVGGSAGGGFFWLFILLLTCLYAYSVWHRIPFAAANLKTGISAIKINYGVCGVAYMVTLLACLWIVVWGLAFIGVTYKESSCENGSCEDGSMDPISFTLLLVSYFWTAQVIRNVLHVTIAGVVGTWWFAPQDASAICSPAIMDSLRRATTYSFGSICMGSLLVAIIRTLKQLAHNARRNGRNSMLMCIAECLLRLIGRIAEYFNKWAFIYVGLYGYDYMTAGKKVMTLFQERGWTTIINDNLVARVLILVCVAIGALTGLVGMFLEHITGWAKGAVEADDVAGGVFFIAVIIGVSLASIIMGVVLSAVDTVVVSFAEAPTEFQANHPQLCQEMMTSWRLVYPNECGF